MKEGIDSEADALGMAPLPEPWNGVRMLLLRSKNVYRPDFPFALALSPLGTDRNA